MIPKHGILDVRVRCNGTVLDEYEAGRQGNTVSCWITSMAGQEFVIEGIGREWPELSDLLLKVFMDGKAIHTVGLWKQEVLAGFCIRGALVGSVAMQPFAFQAIEYTDDERLAKPTAKNGGGSIRIEVFRVSLQPTGNYFVPPIPPKLGGPVHERSKRVDSHTIGLGDNIRHLPQPLMGLVTTPLDPHNLGPHVVYEFRYRSKEFLQALGIILNGASSTSMVPPTPRQTPPLDRRVKMAAKSSPIRVVKQEPGSPATPSSSRTYSFSPNVERSSTLQGCGPPPPVSPMRVDRPSSHNTPQKRRRSMELPEESSSDDSEEEIKLVEKKLELVKAGKRQLELEVELATLKKRRRKTGKRAEKRQSSGPVPVGLFSQNPARAAVVDDDVIDLTSD